MVGYPQEPATPLEKLQTDLKRKAAQLDSADNHISQLTTEKAALKATKAELEQSSRRDRSQAAELSQQLSQAQALLKQRDAAVSSLGNQLASANVRHSGSGGATRAAPTPSRQGSEEEALSGQLSAKTARISKLEAELAEAKSRLAKTGGAAMSALTSAPTSATIPGSTPRRRESLEGEGVAVVGGGGMSAYDANRLRTLRAEVETWKDRSENLMAQVRELTRAQQSSELDKQQLSDSAASLSERCATLAEQLKHSREGLSSLRALADQGREEMRGQLQRKESDLGRAAAAQEAQAALLDELKGRLTQGEQDRERLVLQAQHLQAQLAKAGEEARESNQRVAQLITQLDDKTQRLEGAEAELRDVTGGKASSDSHRLELQARLAALGKEKAGLEAELRQVSERLVEAADTQHSLSEQLKSSRERTEGAGSIAEALRQQLAASHAELAAKERQLADMGAALEERDGAIDGLRRAGTEGEESRGSLAGRMEAVQGHLEAAKAELAAKSAELAELATKLQLTEQEAAEHAKTAQDATMALQAGQGAIDRSRTHGDQEIAQLQEFVRNANVRIEELEAEVESRDADLARSAAKLAQMEGLRREVDTLEQKVFEGEGALRAASNERQGVAQKLQDAQDSLAERQEALEMTHAAVGEKERKINVLEMDLRQAQASLAHVEAQLEDRDERMMEQERRLASLTLEVADLKSELRGAEMARQDLQRDLDAARLEALHSASTVRSAEAELEGSRRRILGLSNDLEEARGAHEADQGPQLAGSWKELAAEESTAHDTTQQVAASEVAAAVLPQQEEAPASSPFALTEALATDVGTHFDAPAPADDGMGGDMSPRETAAVRDQVLGLQARLTSLQIEEGERELAAAAAGAKAAAAAAQGAEATATPEIVAALGDRKSVV